MKIQIQNNTFNAAHTADTQEDNFGGIKERYDLFRVYSNENNGNMYKDKVGTIVKYFDGSFAVFHGEIRYDFERSDVRILETA